MAFITHFPASIINLIFILTISNIVSPMLGSLQTSGGATGGDDNGFEKWISWHVQYYHSRKSSINNYLSNDSMLMNDGKREEDKRNGGSIDEVLEIAEKNKSRIIVSQDGTADVKTIKEAIERIPWNNKFRVIVEIKPGTYWEQIIIPKIKPFITFEGSANNLGEPAVAIKGNASVSGSRKTFDTATVAIDSDYFRATNVKFEAVLTLNGFSKGEDGGGPSQCDGKFHSDYEPVVALSTGWYSGRSRCKKHVTMSANGRSAKAMVVDECDSTMGCDEDHDYQPPCPNNIVDASEAVWKYHLV